MRPLIDHLINYMVNQPITSSLRIRLITREREAKRAYKEAFDALAKSKEKMEASSRQEEGLRKDLLDSFDTYCEAKVGAPVSGD